MKQKIKLSLFLLFAIIILNGYSQNSHWILAPKLYNNTWSSSSLPTLPTSVDSAYHGEAARYSQNIQMDASGNNILFFIVDNKVYDRKGKRIVGTESGFTTYNLVSYQRYQDVHTYNEQIYMTGSASEVIIIPDKNDCNLFHLISSGHKFSPQNRYGGYGQLRVSYLANDELSPTSGLKMYTDTPNGEPSATMRPLEKIIGESNFESITMAHQRTASFSVVDNGTFYTVFYRCNGRLYRFTINNGVITYNDYVTIPGNQMTDRYEMEAIKLSNGNFRIATFIKGYPTGNDVGVYVCDITPSGAKVSGSEKYLTYSSSLFSTTGGISQLFYGLEFNSDGSRVFVSHLPYNGSSGSTLDYWTITGTPAKTQLSTDSQIGIGQIEMAKDGKLYIPRNTTLASISNPNATPSVSLSAVGISAYPTTTGHANGEPQMRLLQDQIDGSTVYSFVQPDIYHASTHNVTSNASWTGGLNGIAPGQSIVNIEKELRIKAGVTLNIKNMTIRFAPGARLVIENGAGTQQGGKLTIDNTTLTSYDGCNNPSMWLGVEVWGNTTASQGTLTNSTQGVLKIENNSTIEHANVGVLLSKRFEFFGSPMIDNYDNNRNGGIVTSTSSNFYNCETGILFQNYNNALLNLTTITNTTFRWNGVFKKSNAKPKYHIRINNRNNITVRSSNFYQQTPSIYSNPTHLGYGIYAVNSTFYVYSSCNILSLPIGQDCPDANTIPSKFENLYMGVRVINSDSKPFTVLRNQFTNCHYGVHSLSAKNQNISRNKMTVHASANEATGIYVSEGTGYRIEENIIEGYNTISSGNQSYGIIIDNSGETHNELYKNTLSKLYVGTQAQRINGKIQGGQNDNTTGLQFICNAYNYPIRLADIGVNGRVDKEQGTTNSLSNIAEARAKAARNTFSMYAENQTTYPDHDIMLYPGSQGIQYVHLNANSHKPDNYSTLGGGADVVPVLQMYAGLPVAPETNTCPTRYGSTGTGIIFEPLGKSAKIDSLNNLIDGGDKQNLLNLIASAPKSEETYHNLIEASPYLSDEVLVAYIKSTASDVQVKGVLVANSGLSKEVSELLEKSKRTNALKADLRMYKVKKSEFRRLKSDIKALEIELHAEQRISISNILDDTTNSNSTEKLINYLKLCRGIEFKQMLLNQYMYQRNYDEFSSLLNELSDKIPSDMVEYYRFKYDFNDNNGIADEALMSKLNHFANGDESKQSAKEAKLLLQILNGEEPAFEILPLQASSKSMMISQSEDQETLKFTESASIRLFPNPSNGIVNITLAELEVSNAVIQLVDLTGKEVFSAEVSKTSNTQVDLSHLKKGTYLIKVTIDQLEPYTQLLRLE